ncbi:MAG: hypothetical protein WC637_14210 [Victivallales bacterium]
MASGATVLNGGWLVRSVTGASKRDSSDPNTKTNALNIYNFDLFPRGGPGGGDPERVYKVYKEILGTTVITKISSDNFNYVIPYVVSLKFTCYNNRVQDMMDIDGNGTFGGTVPTQAAYNYPTTLAEMKAAEATYFPYAIGIELVLLDRTSWTKWIAMGGLIATPDSDPTAAKTFREAHQKTFATMIYLGSRNSRDLPPPPP